MCFLPNFCTFAQFRHFVICLRYISCHIDDILSRFCYISSIIDCIDSFGRFCSIAHKAYSARKTWNSRCNCINSNSDCISKSSFYITRTKIFDKTSDANCNTGNVKGCLLCYKPSSGESCTLKTDIASSLPVYQRTKVKLPSAR